MLFRSVDYGFTAQMENELDEISDGKRDWIPVLDEFWKGFNKLIADKKDVDRPGTEVLDEACPKCGKPLSKRLGKRGNFIGCTGYPECDYTRNLGSEEDAGEARKELGADPATGLPVLLLRGPFGYYVQLGEVEEDAQTKTKSKPKRISWPKELPVADAELAPALQLLQLPKELGNHPDSGKKIIVNIGRFGPYIGHDGKFKSIPRGDSVFTIELARAVELLAQARTSNTVLRELGVHPDDQKPVDVCNGRYGPYVRHGKINATLPKDLSPEEVTLEEALELLAARVAKGPAPKKTPSRKKVAAKKPTTTDAKPTTKKSLALKKPPATRKKSITKKTPAS